MKPTRLMLLISLLRLTRPRPTKPTKLPMKLAPRPMKLTPRPMKPTRPLWLIGLRPMTPTRLMLLISSPRAEADKAEAHKANEAANEADAKTNEADAKANEANKAIVAE